MENTNFWGVVYGIPIILEILVIIVATNYNQNPSIFDLINMINNNSDKIEQIEPILEKELRKIYTLEDIESSSENYRKLRI